MFVVTTNVPSSLTTVAGTMTTTATSSQRNLAMKATSMKTPDVLYPPAEIAVEERLESTNISTDSGTRQQSTLYYLISGGLAGMMEHISMFPLDTLKTRLQAEAYPITLRQCVVTTYKEGGISAFYRGVTAGACGSFPSHAAYFTLYELIKAKLQTQATTAAYGDDVDVAQPRKKWWDLSSYHLPLPVTAALAGAGATTGHDICQTPFDVVKQRLQMSPAGSTLFTTLRSIVAREGIGALYLSLPTTLIMNIPFASAYFATYETLKKFLHASEEELEQSFWKFAVSGGVSGAVAGVISNPFDVIKTRQQLGTLRTGPGLMKAFRAAFLAEGVNIFTRGVRARVLYYIPSAAVQMTSYEFVKWVLRSTSLYNPKAAPPVMT